MFLLKSFLKIKNNICLAPYTSFKIVGGGSNLLVSDKGYSGLVVLMKLDKIELKDNYVIAETGVLLSQVLGFCLKNNLSGLEWTAGIPGTIGGAVAGNAGAFGDSISELVDRVEVLKIDDKKMKFIILTKQELNFSYRSSILKDKKDKYIITKVWLREVFLKILLILLPDSSLKKAV